jgi:hypothetical protein
MDQMCLGFEVSAQEWNKPRNKATDVIREVLMDVLPSGVPAQFARLVSARFTGKSRVTASLIMFDGKPAEVEAWKWRDDSWAHRWISLEGGDISWEDGEWRRVNYSIDA